MDTETARSRPIGWPLMGAGTLLWLSAIVAAIRPDLSAWPPQADGTFITVFAVFALSLLGLLAEQASYGLEPALIASSRSLRADDLNKEAKSAWAKAWRVRWRLERADDEFRLYEGHVALARTLLANTALGGVAWTVYLCATRHPLIAVLAFVTAILLCGAFYRMWEYNTGKIFLLVKAAAKWTDDGTLFELRAP